MEPILQLKNITKVYPGVVANNNISFSLYPGEIHAICGENGAGKTTLMRILFGIEQPSSGEIYYKGNLRKINSPQEAISLGIGMVHQHFMLVPSFTVAQNLVLGMEPTNKTKIDAAKAIEETNKISRQYNLKVEPSAKVSEISVAMMQKLEILKALYRGAKILILDEPTAVLTPQETDELFKELLDFKAKGHTIIFISHKLKEVKAISDRITIIRKGELIASRKTEELTEQEISTLMIGKLFVNMTQHPSRNISGNTVLEVNDVTLKATGSTRLILDSINFNIREGEILGVAGVEGNGQEELVEILTGRKGPDSGFIHFNGKSTKGKGIHILRNEGLSFIPEDRMKDGCVKSATVEENLVTNRLESRSYVSRLGFMNLKKLHSLTNRLIKEYTVKCSTKDEKIVSLSGGNIQKVVVARECSNDPKLLIANQPTRGVDIGAAKMIHEKIFSLSQEGKGILLISADLGELFSVCSSLIVIFDGKITAWFKDLKNLDEKELGLYMLGIKHMGKRDAE
ncbi:ABC transporter ATP-binding protein [uncultured Sphaerochaeta sp.]|uniref:ABC transporter ATP-binding protein n=1 Tax=uncultured Sphaerochaeta sp. TaxID=886478 RepID=UPI002A0A3FD4|nr:ABC transporter ATP-binding protein [uncultured Sphaerochaeta sp.]